MYTVLQSTVSCFPECHLTTIIATKKGKLKSMHHPETPYHSPSKVCPSEHTNIQEQVLQENICPERLILCWRSRWDSILKTFKDMCFCYFVAAPENTNIEAKIGNKDPGGDYRRVTEDWDQAVQRQGAFEELTNWPTPPKALP